jgi:hypothetical protein
MRLDRQSRPIERRHSRLKAMDNTHAPDCGSELAIGVTNEPSINADTRLGARPTIEHDRPTTRRDQQPGRPMTG